MVGLGGKHISVPVFKYYCVINVGRGIGCRVGCITCTADYLVIPSLEGVGVSIVRCSSGIGGNGHLVTMVVGVSGNNSTIPVLKLNCEDNIIQRIAFKVVVNCCTCQAAIVISNTNRVPIRLGALVVYPFQVRAVCKCAVLDCLHSQGNQNYPKIATVRERIFANTGDRQAVNGIGNAHFLAGAGVVGNDNTID